MLRKDLFDSVRIADIMLLERVLRTGSDRRERCKVSSIRYFVDDHDFVIEIQDEVTAHRRSNKTGTSSNENSHPETP